MFFSILKRLKKKRKKGMSLIEVLISLIILAIALLSLAKMPPLTTMLMAKSIHYEEASLIAQQQLEYLEGCSFDSEPLSGDHNFEYALDSVSRDFFDCDYTVTNQFDDNGKLVTVTISWDGDKHKVEIDRTLSRFSQRTVADDAN